jgi:threonine dehydrogenase-like Zn-dependent dehydrogenase
VNNRRVELDTAAAGFANVVSDLKQRTTKGGMLGRSRRDKVKPSCIVSHELPLEKAADAYENFDPRKRLTEVILKPGT